MKILLTGFEPFGDWEENPTKNAVNTIINSQDTNSEDQIRIIGKIIPLRFSEIENIITHHILSVKPDYIILTGQGGGYEIALEQQAKNYVSCKLPYNCGTVIEGKELYPDEVEQLSSSLPLKTIFEKLSSNHVPVRYSDDAGTFGCNQIFYTVRSKFPNIPAGFIHVPKLEAQTEKEDFMSQDLITQSIRLSIDAISESLKIKA